jgi:hypothetical protein
VTLQNEADRRKPGVRENLVSDQFSLPRENAVSAVILPGNDWINVLNFV